MRPLLQQHGGVRAKAPPLRDDDQGDAATTAEVQATSEGGEDHTESGKGHAWIFGEKGKPGVEKSPKQSRKRLRLR